MVSLERLLIEHRLITDHAGRLGDALDAGEAPEVLRAALCQLADALSEHLAHEDADLYPRLILSADVGAASAARDAAAAFDSLAATWSDYQSRWTAKAIAAELAAFTAATRAILGRLAARVQVENELLYPLALQAAHIRLKD